MVKFTVSTKHETLLSLNGCNKEKESLDQDKFSLKVTLRNMQQTL